VAFKPVLIRAGCVVDIAGFGEIRKNFVTKKRLFLTSHLGLHQSFVAS